VEWRNPVEIYEAEGWLMLRAVAINFLLCSEPTNI
jgi:hypothetical protein